MVRQLLENGAWKGWVLGIVASLVVAMIGNDIVFQRDTRETLAKNEERIKTIEMTRGILMRERYERDIDRIDKRLDNIIAAINSLSNTVPTNTEVGQQLHLRDIEIDRLKERIERLERKQ